MHAYDLSLAYSHDIHDCIEACDSFSLSSSGVECVGVAIDVGTLGPAGSLGGSELNQCWLKFNASQSPDYSYTPKYNTKVVNSARRLVAPSVYS